MFLLSLYDDTTTLIFLNMLVFDFLFNSPMEKEDELILAAADSPKLRGKLCSMHRNRCQVFVLTHQFVLFVLIFHLHHHSHCTSLIRLNVSYYTTEFHPIYLCFKLIISLHFVFCQPLTRSKTVTTETAFAIKLKKFDQNQKENIKCNKNNRKTELCGNNWRKKSRKNTCFETNLKKNNNNNSLIK